MPYSADEPQRRDIAVWRGDDDPTHVWSFPADRSPLTSGATFAVAVQWTAGRSITPQVGSGAQAREFVRTSDGGALLLDLATHTIAWPYTIADFEAVPYGAQVSYALQRFLNGKTRTVLRGALTLGSAFSRSIDAPPGQPGEAYVDLRIAALRGELLALLDRPPIPPSPGPGSTPTPGRPVGTLDFSTPANSGLVAAFGA